MSESPGRKDENGKPRDGKSHDRDEESDGAERVQPRFAEAPRLKKRDLEKKHGPSPPGAIGRTCDQSARSGGPGVTFKDQVGSVSRNPEATHVNDNRAGMRNEHHLPSFKDQVFGERRVSSKRSDETIADRPDTSENLSETRRPGAAPVYKDHGPTFKDQVVSSSRGCTSRSENEKTPNSPGAHLSEEIVNARLPSFKDQVRSARHEPSNNGMPSSNGNSGQQHFRDQVRNRDLVEASQPSVRFVEGPGCSSETQSYEDLHTTSNASDESQHHSENLYEAELVLEIEVAKVVRERRRLKRNICVCVVMLNVAMLSALVIGGTCLIGDCIISKESSTEKVQSEIISCVVDVELFCETSDGTVCSDLQPVDSETLTCEAGTITAMQFSYHGDVCGTPEVLPPGSYCVDLEPLVGAVEIRCLDGRTNKVLLVEPEFVQAYDEFIVSNPIDDDDSKFPDNLVCQIIGQNSLVLQRVEIDTSQGLGVYDRFGAMAIEACSNTGCRDILTYNVTVKNTNRDSMSISALEFFPPRGVPVDLMEQESFGLLGVGEAATVSRVVKVDTCLDFDYLAWAFATSTLTNGAECHGGNEFSPTPPPTPTDSPSGNHGPNSEDDEFCGITVDITCATNESLDCSTVEGPSSSASCDSDFSVLRFKYDAEYTCDPFANVQGVENAFCQDLAPLVDDSIIVQCEDGDGESVRVEPSYISYYDAEFKIAPPDGQFPETLVCSLITEDGIIMQKNSFDTSGVVDINRGDRFGAMQVTGCTYPSCVIPLIYNITLTSAEELPWFVQGLTLESNEQYFFLSSSYDESVPSSVSVNQSISVRQTVQLDPCLDESPTVEVSFNARSFDESGQNQTGVCEPTIRFDPTRTGPAECDIYSFVTCTLGNGQFCTNTETEPRQGSCSSRDIFALEFRYRDTRCGDNDDLPSQCSDFAELQEETEIQCMDENGLELNVEPPKVELFEQFRISRPDRRILNGAVDCLFMSLGGNLLQRHVLHTVQMQNFEEGSRAGGLELIACSDISCRETTTYNLTVSNEGSELLFLTELELDADLSSLQRELPDSLLPYVGKNSIDPGESTSVTIDVERDFCFGSSSTRVSPVVEAETGTGVTCGEGASSAGSSGSGPSGDSQDPAPSSDSDDRPPTVSPAGEESTFSREAIFGLVATGITLELLICFGMYVYYQRWKVRRKTSGNTSSAQKPQR